MGDAFLVEGGAMRRSLEAIGCPASRIRIQRIAVDPSRYRFGERSDPGTGDLVILQCGRMVPKKGFPSTVAAFARIRDRHPRARLRLIGDGPERTAVESAVRDLGLTGVVTLVGALTRAEFLQEMERAHIYVQPSRRADDGDSEGGAPTALLEAQACGLPVLSTRHADIPEIVSPDRSALLVPEGDDDALAQGMIDLLARPERWPAMGRAGRGHVEEHHDVHRRAAELEILYARLAETRGLPSP
jgi:colanic acid/amylovoran biosynthesis glycosyltransferase